MNADLSGILICLDFSAHSAKGEKNWLIPSLREKNETTRIGEKGGGAVWDPAPSNKPSRTKPCPSLTYLEIWVFAMSRFRGIFAQFYFLTNHSVKWKDEKVFLWGRKKLGIHSMKLGEQFKLGPSPSHYPAPTYLPSTPYQNTWCNFFAQVFRLTLTMNNCVVWSPQSGWHRPRAWHTSHRNQQQSAWFQQTWTLTQPHQSETHSSAISWPPPLCS